MLLLSKLFGPVQSPGFTNALCKAYCLFHACEIDQAGQDYQVEFS